MNSVSKAASNLSKILFYHIPESPPCRAVEMVASLVGVELEKCQLDLFAKEHLSEEYLRLNPRHKVPAIVDGNLTLGESRAIMRYLVNRGPDSPLYPRDAKKRAKIDELLDFDIGTLYMNGIKLYWPVIFRGTTELDENVQKKHYTDLTLLEKELKDGRKFLIGNDLTIGDVAVATTLTLPISCGFEYKDYPSISGYMQRIRGAIPKYGDINDRAIENMSNFAKQNRR